MALTEAQKQALKEAEFRREQADRAKELERIHRDTCDKPAHLIAHAQDE